MMLNNNSLFAKTKSNLQALVSSRIMLAVFTSCILLMILFPDAIFLGAGLGHTSNYIAFQSNREHRCFYPQPGDRQWHHAFADAGGAMWQSEPGQQFLRGCLRTGESPYWNPYSGAGQLGPETLVDLKFSFQALLMSIFGGQQIVLNAIILISYFVAISFLYLFFRNFLSTSHASAFAGCCVYVLNGYNTATVGSNTSQVYLYFPVLLYVLASFATRPTTLKFLCLVFVDCVVLSTTFFPTVFLLLATCHFVTTGYMLMQWRIGLYPTAKLAVTIVLLQISAAVSAFLLLSFLYFPIIESFKVVDAVSMYAARQFFPVDINSLLSFFSPKHFWEEYQALPPDLWTGAAHNKNFKLIGNIYHFGIIPAIIASSVLWTRRRTRAVAVVAFAILLFSVGRIFNLPIIATIVQATYGIRSLGEQYWFIAVAIGITIASALGFDALKNRHPSSWLPVGFLCVIVVGIVIYLFQSYGIVPPHTRYKTGCVSFILSLVPLSLLLVFLVKSTSERVSRAASALLLCLMVIELTFDTMYDRYELTEFFRRPPDTIAFLQKNCGLYRVACMGLGVLPPECGSAFQIQQIETLNMNILPSYEALFKHSFNEDPKDQWGRFATLSRHSDDSPVNLNMLNLLGVKYLVVSSGWKRTAAFLAQNGWEIHRNTPEWVIWENNNVYPRLFTVSRLVVSQTIPDIQQAFLRTVAYTTDKKLLALASQLGLVSDGRDVAAPADTSVIKEYHHDRVVAKVELKQPAILVLTDNWHPSWQATIDNEPAYIGIVDQSFRGIVLPAGRHKVVMTYMPKSLPVALAVSGFVAFLLILLLFFRKPLDILLDLDKKRNAGLSFNTNFKTDLSVDLPVSII